MAIQKYSNFNFGYCIFSVLISSVSSGYQPLQRVTLSLKTSTTLEKNLKFYQLNGILVSVSFKLVVTHSEREIDVQDTFENESFPRSFAVLGSIKQNI